MFLHLQRAGPCPEVVRTPRDHDRPEPDAIAFAAGLEPLCPAGKQLQLERGEAVAAGQVVQGLARGPVDSG